VTEGGTESVEDLEMCALLLNKKKVNNLYQLLTKTYYCNFHA
jgi:hypothetical protein